MFEAIIVGLIVWAMAQPSDAKDVYVQGPRLVGQEAAAKLLAHGAQDIYACTPLKLKVTAKVVKVRGPKTKQLTQR